MHLSRCSTDLREYMKRSVCVHLSRVWSSISYLAISFSGFPFYKGQSEFVFEMNLSYRLGFLLSSIPIAKDSTRYMRKDGNEIMQDPGSSTFLSGSAYAMTGTRTITKVLSVIETVLISIYGTRKNYDRP